MSPFRPELCHWWQTSAVELVVKVSTWMVQDGGEPELAVGDDWSVDLLFHPDEQLQAAAEDAVLSLTPEPVGESLSGYRLTAKVHRLPATSTHVEGLALEVPGVLLGYSRHPPLPPTPVVTGRGTLATDNYGRRMSWAFPEAKRYCVVEKITLVTAPLIPSPASPATHVPDWTRRADTSIQRMRMWQDEPAGGWATYFVTVRLLDW